MSKRKKITEQAVAGIYAQNQYKIETIPGYAEGYKRVYDLMTKLLEPDFVETDKDRDELKRAMAELYIIEHYGGKPKP